MGLHCWLYFKWVFFWIHIPLCVTTVPSFLHLLHLTPQQALILVPFSQLSFNWSVPSSLNTSCSCSSFLIYDNGIKINSTTCSKSYTLHKVDFFTQKLTFYRGLHVIKVGRTNTYDNTVSVSTNSVQICVEDIPQNVTIDYPSNFGVFPRNITVRWQEVDFGVSCASYQTYYNVQLLLSSNSLVMDLNTTNTTCTIPFLLEQNSTYILKIQAVKYSDFSHKFLKSNSSAITFLACGELFSKPVIVTPNNSCSPETLEWTLSAWSACDSNYLKSSASFQVYLATSDYPLAAFGGVLSYNTTSILISNLKSLPCSQHYFWRVGAIYNANESISETCVFQYYCPRSRIDMTHIDIFYPKNKYEANSWVAIISVIILF